MDHFRFVKILLLTKSLPKLTAKWENDCFLPLS